MDVITLSSDSEASDTEARLDAGKRNLSQACLVDYQSENCIINWNDDDDDDDEVRPAINYSFETPESEVARQLNDVEFTEEFITPQKSDKKITRNDFQINSDKNITPYQDNLIRGSISSASDSENLSQNSNSQISKTKRRPKLSQEEKQREKVLKEQKKLEKEMLREKKKTEQQRQKALKAVFFENQRNLKPEENIKFLKVHIDNNIINSNFGGNIISSLQENNIQYVVECQKKNFTVTWSKKRVQKTINDLGELIENVEIIEENILLYVLDWKKAAELIYKNELLSHVETIRSAYFDKKLILIIYGMEKYFNYKKNKRNHDIKALVNDKKKAKPKTSERIFEEAPNLTKDQLEFALTDLQLIGKYSCRLLETPEEFSALILNITKSLSQVDYKMERQKRQVENFGWIASDSHQSIKVDKSGNGLLRLWQQQICQFSSVGLEAAQAVVSQYNSPLALINQYEKTESIKERELLLQNIQIRREAGILSTSRRIGPQLSKKIYKFFTSDDPDVEL